MRISEAATGVGEEMADVGLAMQRALDKTENMKARADAVQELEAAGTFDDITALGPAEDDIDRQLKELSSTSEVDDELAKMKAELGSGSSGAGRAARRRRRRPPRRRRTRRRPAGAAAMIVRISAEGQYELADDEPRELNELDNAGGRGRRRGDEAQFHDAFDAAARATCAARARR